MLESTASEGRPYKIVGKCAALEGKKGGGRKKRVDPALRRGGFSKPRAARSSALRRVGREGGGGATDQVCWDEHGEFLRSSKGHSRTRAGPTTAGQPVTLWERGGAGDGFSSSSKTTTGFLTGRGKRGKIGADFRIVGGLRGLRQRRAISSEGRPIRNSGGRQRLGHYCHFRLEPRPEKRRSYQPIISEELLRLVFHFFFLLRR